MKPKPLLFVINPKSGNSDKSKLEGKLALACTEHDRKYTIFRTTGKDDDKKLQKKITELKPETVIACGGDGTVNMVANLILHQEIKLGIIPLGSANGLANELEIKDNIDDALTTLFKNKTLKMDVIRINDSHICLHLSDVGFNANMIKDFEKSGERGMMAYAKSFFSSLMDKQTTDFTLTINKKIQKVAAEMIVLANASSYGTGAVINPGSRMDDGSFEVVVFRSIPLKELISLTVDSFIGDIKNSPYVNIYKTQSVEITCHTHELLQVDGELKGEVNQITAKVEPGALLVIC